MLRSLLSLLTKHKFKIGGGLAVLAVFIAVVAWGQFHKMRADKAEGALIDMRVVEIELKEQLVEAKTLAMTPQEIEEKIKVVYIEKGQAAKKTGFIYTKKQVAKCNSCLELQKDNKQLVADALRSRNKSNLRAALAIRSKKKWKSRALVGIPAGIAVGIIANRLIK